MVTGSAAWVGFVVGPLVAGSLVHPLKTAAARQRPSIRESELWFRVPGKFPIFFSPFARIELRNSF